MGSQRNKLLPAALGTVAVAAMVGGMVGGTGLYATLTENVNRTQEIKAGTVVIAVGGGDASLNDTVSGIMPGGTISSNAREVKNGGSLQFGKVDASVKATGELLDDPAPFALDTKVSNFAADGTGWGIMHSSDSPNQGSRIDNFSFGL